MKGCLQYKAGKYKRLYFGPTCKYTECLSGFIKHGLNGEECRKFAWNKTHKYEIDEDSWWKSNLFAQAFKIGL